MTRRRWTADRVEGDRAFLLGDHAQHLSRVLRAQVGQEYDVATPAGVRLGRIVSVQEGCVDFLLGDFLRDPVRSTPDIALALAVFKFDRMDWAIEKCTELGVTKIIPFLAARTEKHLAQAAAKRADRWRRLVTQASEQSRRATPPEVTDPVKFDQILVEDAPVRIVLAESEPVLSLASSLTQVQGRILLAVGPEGGWTPGELKRFDQSGWYSASLGPTILRAETAAIAALAITFSELQPMEASASPLVRTSHRRDLDP
jgi:16S rRNA (uracil1498-N3)-methyltransferase